MSTVENRFLEPLDVLFLRGNKLFGDPGSCGEALILPWPSVAAGAIRSRMLADERVDLAAFARNEINHPTIGTPEQPGTFTVTAFHLARKQADGLVELLIAPPADLVVLEDPQGDISVRALTPTRTANGISASAPLPFMPVLAEDRRRKSNSGYWLTEAGWRRYLGGQVPLVAQLVRSSALWSLDHRVGVGLDAASGRAADGRLFSVQAVAMTKQGHYIGTDRQTGKAILASHDVGFLATIAGAETPTAGTVRLGGDGRAAALIETEHASPEPDYGQLVQARRCRLVLTTPGIFTKGWLPQGSGERGADGTVHFSLHGVSGRIISAAVPRAGVVSGWDIANRKPKPAQRAAPIGSVYWLELDDSVSPDALSKLVESGLWGEPCEDATRRAEGFNRITLAAY